MRKLHVALLAGVLCSSPVAAFAQEEDGQLRLMREPHSYTDVVDAFDQRDPFDINVSAGYQWNYMSGTVQRQDQTFPAGVDPNRESHNWTNIAHAHHTQNILNLRADIGLWRDFALFGRMPIILSDNRGLSQIGGVDPSSQLQAPYPTGMGTAPPLFQVGSNGFRSPTRSGLNYLAGGLAWSILNQNRTPWLPTWVLLVEGQFNIGTPLRACQQTMSGPQCRQWTQSPGGMWTMGSSNNAGMTRGTDALRIETRASWRSRYVEAYTGLMFRIAFPVNARYEYLPSGSLQGYVNRRPPIFGQLTGGMAIIPWEDRGKWQRFAIDFRVMGRYVSEGRGYSPLFDALGTSNNAYLTSLKLEGTPTPGADLRAVPFFGITDMQAHAQVGGRFGLEMRAARYVRFNLGANVWYVQPYILTFSDACNPNVSGVPMGDPRIGTCRQGIVNPNERQVIDMPGQRFRLTQAFRVSVFLNATAMF